MKGEKENIMVTWYWAGQYAAVFAGYFLLMFVWPSIVFRKHLQKKGKMYWFSFCVIVQVILINTIVLGLGFLHLLNRWTVMMVFYGVPVWTFLRKFSFQDVLEQVDCVYRVAAGAYGVRSFVYRYVRIVRDCLWRQWKRVWGMLRSHLDYLSLAAILVYGMIYFSYGAFQDYSYGFGDIYTHHAWIQGLVEGKIFLRGVYPEGMHCFVYCLHVLFGIRIYSCLLFLAGIHIITFLLSVYSLLREVFHSRLTPLIALTLFLILDLTCVNELYAMARFQWTIPQEFGMYAQFLCALYLIRYLRSSRRMVFRGRLTKNYWDENLLLFLLALAVSIAVHFYVTIMAFFLCVSVVLFSIKKVFSRKHFVPLVVSVLCGVTIAVAPMLLALASGIPFQGSIGWAVNVMKREQSQEVAAVDVKEQTEEMKVGTTIGEIGRKIFEHGYCELYGRMRAVYIVAFTVLAAVLWFIWRLSNWILNRCFKRQLPISDCCFDGYLPIIVASVLFMIDYVAGSLGLPQLVAGERICAVEQMLIVSVMAMPVDMLFSLLGMFCKELVLQCMAVCCMAGIYVSAIKAGVFHGYLFWELTRYNSSVTVTDFIMERFPKDSYTIVSPTDELYQVIQHGFHEEWSTFLQNIEKKDSYKLPTEYVFLYVEKRPISYAQAHFFVGPSWLAEEKYLEFFNYTDAGRCPDIVSSKVSEEKAQEKMELSSGVWNAYKGLENRTILESKAYKWCQEFLVLYPNELKTCYEDENFVCYYFKQEIHAPYDLAIE